MDKLAATPVSLRSLIRFQITLLSGFVLLALTAFGLMRFFAPGLVQTTGDSQQNVITAQFLFYIAVGFTAQLIDGALGMAYGVTSTSLLLNAGVPPAVASASVHTAEVVTSGVSGFSHWRFGNVRSDLLRRLALPGAVGAALGAYVLTSFESAMLRPYVAAYLLIMGAVILYKALRKNASFKPTRSVGLLALVGGFVDASGGGGWGPVVTSSLLGSGREPRTTIGTVNASEFVVAATASGVLSVFIGLSGWPVVLGLIGGGVLAAPVGAYLCHKINSKVCMLLVGLLIIVLSLRNLGVLF
jgi:uncharacterized membrane protein YfcA